MKIKVVQILILVFKGVLQVAYFFLKCLPIRKNKVVFCSRQSDVEPLDFTLIREELVKKISYVECVVICCRIGSGIKAYVRYAAALFRSMYHLATGRVCIIDSYWPAVSLLRHRKVLKVIQLWHSIGKIKKSGYQTIGKKSGRKTEYAYLLNIHENYDYVIAGAKIWNRYYCESFNIAEDKILNFGLPRIDYLLKTEEKNKTRFFKQFSEWRNKKIILYAPTFRRNMNSHWKDISIAVNDEDFVLIIKQHPSLKHINDNESENHMYLYLDEWKTIDLLAVCDYLITDYSAIAIEAAVLKKTTYYWVYDYEEYLDNNGMNIDLYNEFPGYVYKNIFDLMDTLKKREKDNKWDVDAKRTYCSKYLPGNMGTATQNIVDLVYTIISE